MMCTHPLRTEHGAVRPAERDPGSLQQGQQIGQGLRRGPTGQSLPQRWCGQPRRPQCLCGRLDPGRVEHPPAHPTTARESPRARSAAPRGRRSGRSRVRSPGDHLISAPITGRPRPPPRRSSWPADRTDRPPPRRSSWPARLNSSTPVTSVPNPQRCAARPKMIGADQGSIRLHGARAVPPGTQGPAGFPYVRIRDGPPAVGDAHLAILPHHRGGDTPAETPPAGESQ